MPNITLGEMINRYPRFVADMVQYYGWRLSDDAMDELKAKLDGPSFRAVLKTSKNFYR